MKPRRKKRTKRRARRGIFVLPNLFTSASLFGGFFAIIASIQGRFEAAAVAIIISSVFDGLDGRIARFTQTTSHFGNEYDSLSDLISFGVAPGIMAFLWALEPFGRLGWLAAFMYVICGALRLARFNVQKDVVKSKYFRGLPIPAAACFVASAVLFTSALSGIPTIEPIAVIVMMYALSFLMVSTINYFSFKEFDIRHKKPFNVLVSIILVLVLVAYKPKIILFFTLLSYVLSGPLVTLYRKSAKRSKMSAPGFDAPAVRDEEDMAGVNEQESTG